MKSTPGRSLQSFPFASGGSKPPRNGTLSLLTAVGRKNYLFAGSDKGAERAATLYTVLGTAKAAGAEPLAYLTDVLDRTRRGWPGFRIRELLPDAWVRRKQGQGPTEPG